MNKKFVWFFCGLLVAGWLNGVSADSAFGIKLSDGSTYYLVGGGSGNWNVKNTSGTIVGTIQRNESAGNYSVRNSNGLDLGSTAIINPDALDLLNNQPK